MDPVRRALLLLMFVSVVMTEPAQARAITVERESLPAIPPAQWIHRLAVSLRRTVEPAAVATTRQAHCPALLSPAPLDAQVETAHPAREAHAFRLPPPTRAG